MRPSRQSSLATSEGQRLSHVLNSLSDDTQVIDQRSQGVTPGSDINNNAIKQYLELQIPTSNDYENVTNESMIQNNNQSGDALEPTHKPLDNTASFIKDAHENTGDPNDTTTNQIPVNFAGLEETPFKNTEAKNTFSAPNSISKIKKSAGSTSDSPWLKHVKDPFSSDSPLKQDVNDNDNKHIDSRTETEMKIDNPHEIFSRLRDEQKEAFSEIQNLTVDMDTQKLDLESFRFGDTQPLNFGGTDTQKSFLKFDSDTSQKIYSQNKSRFNFHIGSVSELDTQKIGSTQGTSSIGNMETQKILSPTNEEIQKTVTQNDSQYRLGQDNNMQASSYPIVGTLKREIFISQSSESNDEKEPDLQIPGTIDVTNGEIKQKTQEFDRATNNYKNDDEIQPSSNNVLKSSEEKSYKNTSAIIPSRRTNSGETEITENTASILPENDCSQAKRGKECTSRTLWDRLSQVAESSTPMKLGEQTEERTQDHRRHATRKMFDKRNRLSQSPIIQESSPAIRDATDIIGIETPTKRSRKRIYFSDDEENGNVEQSLNQEITSSPPPLDSNDNEVENGNEAENKSENEDENENEREKENRANKNREKGKEGSALYAKNSKVKSIELIDDAFSERNVNGNVEQSQKDKHSKAESSMKHMSVSSSTEDVKLHIQNSKRKRRNSNSKSIEYADSDGEKNYGQVKRQDADKVIKSDSNGIEKIKKLIRKESDELAMNHITNESAVWAVYEFRYYPAIILSKVNNQFDVQFFDTNALLNEADILLPLDITIGDIVKLHGKNETYIVNGLEKSSRDESEISCMRGYNTIYLKRFIRGGVSNKYPEIAVSLWDIYMTESSWQKRKKTQMRSGNNSKNDVFFSPGNIGNKTNVTGLSNRAKLKNAYHLLNSNHTSKDEQFYSLISSPDVSPIKPKIKTTIFQNAAFCLTGEREDERVKLTSMIIENGGIVLKEGFETLFNITKDKEDNVCRLQIANQFKTIKFSAVIAKTYSRSQKYLQALALGWPTLSSNFIVDCVKNSRWLDNWASYVLAAGESKILETIQSVDLSRFKENYMDFSEPGLTNQLSNNSHVLKNYVVLIISKKPAVSEFLFHVLGAKSLRQVSGYNYTIFDITREIQEENKVKNVKFLLYDNLDVDEIYDNLAGISNSAIISSNFTSAGSTVSSRNSRKRAKTENGTISTRSRRGVFRKGATKAAQAQKKVSLELVNWEWVVQCIISSNCWKTTKQFDIEK